MKGILEMLYDGEIFPPVKQEQATERLRDKRRKTAAAYERLMERLGEEDRQAFREVMDADLDVIAEEIRAAYISGFRLGMSLLSESLFGER